VQGSRQNSGNRFTDDSPGAPGADSDLDHIWYYLATQSGMPAGRVVSTLRSLRAAARNVLSVTANTPSGPIRDGTCIIGTDFNSANFFWISHLIPIPGAQSLNRLVREEMAQHGFATPPGSGPGTLHFLRLRPDWIYLRGFAPDSSGVTRISSSDHNAPWVKINK
jgi:hypothetical protein